MARVVLQQRYLYLSINTPQSCINTKIKRRLSTKLPQRSSGRILVQNITSRSTDSKFHRSLNPPPTTTTIQSTFAEQLQHQPPNTTTPAPTTPDPLSSAAEFKLVGYKSLVRSNPKSDTFPVRRFHHIEFWCGDATNTARRFSWGLGMPLTAKSDLSTGNSARASSAATPSFSLPAHRSFTSSHGLSVRTVAIHVDSAFSAYSASVSLGAKPVSPPILLSDNKTAIAEVHLYGDAVLRYVSCDDDDDDDNNDKHFPPVDGVASYQELDYGIRKLGHAVGNVPKLEPVVEYLKKFLGFHEFAEFTAGDIGTAQSRLNSVVLANNDENVLLPLNEPVFGTKRKSQIQTYLEHNKGSCVQHLVSCGRGLSSWVVEGRL